VKKKKDKRRSMQSETEENRAIEKQNTSFFFLCFFVFVFLYFLEERDCEIVNEESGKVWFEVKGLYLYRQN
jgi:hypothetical protein